MKGKNFTVFTIMVLCVFLFTQLLPNRHSTKLKEPTQGQTIMKQLAKQDVNEIDVKIQSIQEKFKLANIEVGSFSARFSNTIILGDSLSEGLLAYGIMPSNLVLAKRGNRTNNVDRDIESVIRLAPKAVFMEYGINDLGYCRGDEKLFVSQYSEQIKKLQKGIPNIKIYINSLTPIAQFAQNDNPAYTHVDAFNIALIQMCRELKVTYIDNTKLLNFHGDVYEYDGVHPKYPYYPIWLEHMLSVAGL